jgi:hypothetical protein
MFPIESGEEFDVQKLNMTEKAWHALNILTKNKRVGCASVANLYTLLSQVLPTMLPKEKDTQSIAVNRALACLRADITLDVPELARKMGMSEKKAKRLADAALLHDIGKIGVPDSVLNSIMSPKDYPEIGAWLNKHDIDGGLILEETSPFKAKIARGHHPYKKLSTGSTSENLVTVADIYDAIISPRSYHSQRSKDFALYDKKGGLEYNVGRGQISQDYLDFIRALDKDGLLNEYYDDGSDIRDAYRSMKANGITDPIYEDLVLSNTVGGALAGGSISLMIDLIEKNLQEDNLRMPDKGGLESTNIPTASDLFGAISPTYRKRGDKINDIKRWYERGYSNADLEHKIITTDFNNNKQVTELWKAWKDFIDNQK